jgi:hypothetical protein
MVFGLLLFAADLAGRHVYAVNFAVRILSMLAQLAEDIAVLEDL